MEITGLKLPNEKLVRSFSFFSGCAVGVVAAFNVVLHPPVNFKSANLLTNFWVLRIGIGLFSISIFSDDVDFADPLDRRLPSPSLASSILNTTSSIEPFPLTFEDSDELVLALFSIFFPPCDAFKSWNFSFFFKVLWFCLAKWSPSVSASSSASSTCLSKDVIDDDADVEPDDSGGVVLSCCDGGGKSITKSGCNRLRVKIADCGWFTFTFTCNNKAPSALVVLALFCHFSRFCWKILNGWYSLLIGSFGVLGVLVGSA